MRAAMAWRMARWRSAADSVAAGGGGGASVGRAGLAAGGVLAVATAAPSTSARVIAPLRPVPWIAWRSTPSWCARRRTTGETGLACRAGARGGSGEATGGGVVSAGECTVARTVPTGTRSPSATRSCSMTPPWKISTSIAALSVSTRATTSPRLTVSPGLTCHSSRVPASMSAPSDGMRNSATARHHAAGRVEDAGHLGKRGVLEILCVGDGYLGAAHPRDRCEDGCLVQWAERAQVDHLGLDAVRGQGVGGFEGLCEAAAVGDQGHVAARAAYGGAGDVDGAGVRRQLTAQVVERAVLEEQDRVGVLQGSPQHATGVLEGRRREHLDAGNVGVPAFQAVGVLGGELAAGPGGHADDQRDAELPTRHVQDRGGIVDDLVQRQQAEVDGHDLHDGPHTAQGGADSGTDEGRLRQRRVADALGAELLQQALADPEAPAVAADVLAHQEHAPVALQRLAQRLPECLAVGELDPGPGRGALASRRAAHGVASRYTLRVSSPTGSGVPASANATAWSISAPISASMRARPSLSSAFFSISRAEKVAIGSRRFHVSTSSLVRYSSGSYMEWARNR